MKITLLSPVRHDGKDYNEDDSIEMDDVAANALIEAGAATFSGKKSAKAAPKATPKTSEQSDASNTDQSGGPDAQDDASGGAGSDSGSGNQE